MIKGILYHCLFGFLSLTPVIFIQAQDSVKAARFGWGGTPILAFDQDLGLRYGAVINLFDYGQPVQFPNYAQYLNIRAFNSTKGTSNLSMIYETARLVPKSILFLELTFIKDSKLDFFGFNGAKSLLNPSFTNTESSFYINPFYYAHQRRLSRLQAIWHKPLSTGNWNFLLGAGWVQYLIEDLDFNRFDLPLRYDGIPARQESLYGKYIDWGIIQEDEKHGGSAVNLLAGIAYDSRNGRINCTNGLWFETYFTIFSGKKSKILAGKHIMTFRHYLELPGLKSVLTWRISSQQKIGGTIPFYMLPVYFDTRQNQDGVGGAFTLRGANRNRIAANGFVLGNMEWRSKILQFTLLKLNWEVELSAFADAVFITQEYQLKYLSVPGAEFNKQYRSTQARYL
ncbi:MAG: hypothetical protein HC905_17035 [Bacteroidales bacterium]|nr:hypothetical protein [Bacteroidales bacterium]